MYYSVQINSFRKLSFSSVMLLLVLLTPSFAAAPEQSEEIVGDWTGKLEPPGSTSELRLVLHIKRNDKGMLFSTMDSPNQGAEGIPASSITYTDKDLEIRFASIGGTYRAKLLENGRLDGIWSQGGARMDLPMIRLDEAKPSGRPQDPQPPFPYSNENMDFVNENAGITLSGTLSIPEGDGPFPAVVLISGSGQQDRDGALMLDHRPFLVLADYLSRHGIAVLRYDDRGYGKSGGSFHTADSRDFAADALAGKKHLQSHPKIDSENIGIIGHSEGGYIAAMIAADNPDIPFIVSLAGSGIPGGEIIKKQTSLILKAYERSDNLIKWNRQLQEKMFQIITEEKDDAIAKQQIRDFFRSFYNGLTKKEQKEFSEHADINSFANMNASQLTSPWFRFFVEHNPAEDWEKVKCPVLAVIGSKDLQVPPKENLEAIGKALQKAGNKRVTLQELDGLNHLFQNAKTGAPDEYSQIDETFAPSVMKLLRDWILKTVSS